MASSDFEYIDTTGVIVPDVSNVQAEVIELFQAAFGSDLITDPSTPQGVLIAMFTTLLTAMIQNNAQLANQINPNLAGGVFLDAICALTGLQRTPAQSTTVLATIIGTPGTIIPTTAIAVTTSGVQFSPEQPIEIPAGVDNITTGLFKAVIPGAVAVPPGTLTIIQSGPIGWQAVTNAAAGNVGGGVESDAALRLLRQQTLAFNSTSMSESIISALLASKVCSSVGFQENIESSMETIGGVSMLPNSIYACVTSDNPISSGPLSNTQVALIIMGTPGTTVGTLNLASANVGLSAVLPVVTLTSTYAAGVATVTAVCDTAGLFADGQLVTIAGATPSDYNGNYTITLTSPTTFMYAFNIGSAPVTPATGTITASQGGNTYAVTVEFDNPVSGLIVGQQFTVANATNTSYNGTFTILNTTSSDAIIYETTFGSAPSSDTGVAYLTGVGPTPYAMRPFLVSDGTNEFQLIEPVIITAVGEGVGYAQAVDANPTLNVPANTLTNILTPLPNVTSVTNPFPNSAYSSGFLQSVGAILLATKSAGAQWSSGVANPPFGPQTVLVLDQFSNQDYSVVFDVPTPVSIFIQVTVTTVGSLLFDQASNIFVADPVQACIDAILAYAASYLGVGVDVSAFGLAAAISAANPGLLVTNLQTTTSSSYATTPITIEIFQIASIVASNITVSAQ